MALYLKLAIRNVFRNRRRTVITVAAMGFGAAAIIVFGGFVNAIYWGVRESTIRSQVGHIQLYRKGFSEKGNLAPYEYLIGDYAALRAELVKLEHVKTVTARLGFSGLVSTATRPRRSSAPAWMPKARRSCGGWRSSSKATISRAGSRGA